MNSSSAIVGAVDDGDPGNDAQSRKSYQEQASPTVGILGSTASDGTSIAQSRCDAPNQSSVKLFVEGLASQGQNPRRLAVATAKAESVATLVVRYDWIELFQFYFRRSLGLRHPKNVNCYVFGHIISKSASGPATVGYTVRVSTISGQLVFSYSELHTITPDPRNPLTLIETLSSGSFESRPNPGRWDLSDNGIGYHLAPGNYQLFFELNASAQADGSVGASCDAELKIL